jgi:hypothetical protein
MENTANLGLRAIHKIVSEYTERIYAYIEKTQRYTKLRISRYLNNGNFDSFFLYKMGRIKQKNHFTLLSLQHLGPTVYGTRKSSRLLYWNKH